MIWHLITLIVISTILFKFPPLKLQDVNSSYIPTVRYITTLNHSALLAYRLAGYLASQEDRRAARAPFVCGFSNVAAILKRVLAVHDL